MRYQASHRSMCKLTSHKRKFLKYFTSPGEMCYHAYAHPCEKKSTGWKIASTLTGEWGAKVIESSHGII